MMKHPRGFGSDQSGNLSFDMFGWLWNCGTRIGFVVMGESNHNIGKFESSKEGFSVLWETLSIICSDHCFFFLVQLRKLHCVWKCFILPLWEQMSWELGVSCYVCVLECVELFVLFNFMGYSMYGDMFHSTLVENNFKRVRVGFCKYWNCHKHDQLARWKWNQNMLISYDA